MSPESLPTRRPPPQWQAGVLDSGTCPFFLPGSSWGRGASGAGGPPRGSWSPRAPRTSRVGEGRRAGESGAGVSVPRTARPEFRREGEGAQPIFAEGESEPVAGPAGGGCGGERCLQGIAHRCGPTSSVDGSLCGRCGDTELDQVCDVERPLRRSGKLPPAGRSGLCTQRPLG